MLTSPDTSTFESSSCPWPSVHLPSPNETQSLQLLLCPSLLRSSLALPQTIQTTRNPRPNTNWIPSITDQSTQASIPTSVSGLVPALMASGHPPTYDRPNPPHFHQTQPCSPYRIISHCLTPSDPELTILVHTPDSSLLHPHCLQLLALVYK